VLLIGNHPAIAARSCERCLVEQYDEETGKVELGRDGKPLLRILDNGPEFLAPCRDPNRSCPKGTPENPKSLWPENEICYDHFKECQAVNQWPDDAVVKRNAAAIMQAEKEIEESKQIEAQLRWMRLVAAK
jgi:hypothetical protein